MLLRNHIFELPNYLRNRSCSPKFFKQNVIYMLEPNKCCFSTYSQLLTRKVDVEQLKLEQNYQPTTSEELSEIAAEADIEESIEELLHDLKNMG